MKINFKDILLAPNLISLFRLCLAVPFIYFLELSLNDSVYFSYIIYLILIAFVSDILDGYIARKINKITELGKLLDPIADKILVAIIIIYLYLMNKVPLFYLYAIILRDLIIFAGGIFVSRRIGRVLPSNLLGKATVFSIGLFFITILFNASQRGLLYIGLLYISLTLSILSVFGYTIRAFEFLSQKKNEINPST